MNYGALVFLGAFVAVSLSWFGMVLSPQVQLGRQTQGTNSVNTAELYPVQRPGLAREGLEVYRANGCVYCHSQQVRQSGTAVNVILTDAGTNAAAAADALMKSRAGVTDANAVGLSAGLPKAILTDVDVDRARAAVEALTSAGAKAEIEIVPVGTDIAWNWGIRRSVAHDYLYDSPVLLGSLRVGPDLANVGARLPDANWHYRHLYAPRSVVEGSAMPAYPYLFERRPIQGQPSPDAIESKDGFEIVPTSEARALVAYLLSLRADVPLFESPVSVEPPPQETADTNSAAGTNVVSPQASASAQ